MAQPCPHRPGLVVEIDPDVVWSTCVAGCDAPIWQLYDIGDEDRAATGWGNWRIAPVPVDAADAAPVVEELPELAVA